MGWSAFVLAVFVIHLAVTAAFGNTGSPFEPQRRQQRRPATRQQAPKKPRIDYTNFSHRTHVEQQKLECSSCHKLPTRNWKEVRKGDDAFPDVAEFPEHNSCLNCHREQFFARERPAPSICSNCHVAVTPKNTVRFIFPSLGEPFFTSKRAEAFNSEFVVAFPHDKHGDDVVSEYRPREEQLRIVAASFRSNNSSASPEQKNCTICHKLYKPQGNSKEEFVTLPPKNLAEDAFWLRKGTFQNTPLTHTLCFTCHSTDSGLEPLPTNCGTCHKFRNSGMQHDYDPKIAATMGVTDPLTLIRWSRRSAIRFRHEHEVHKELTCDTCHVVSAMNLLNEKTLVSVKSCGGEGSGCHVESNNEGILNFEIDQKKKKPDFQCTKCHLNLGKQAVPADHLEALPKK
jgi:cytochrome c7-like protein/class III cytochrome C family protein